MAPKMLMQIQNQGGNYNENLKFKFIGYVFRTKSEKKMKSGSEI